MVGRAALIIPAAGSGTRVGARVAKAFLDLGGVPIIFRTLTAFAGLSEVTERIVVLAKTVCEQLPGEMERGLAALVGVRITPGGDRRQDSVRNGLAAVGDGAELVLVHDAARPFVSQRTITAVLTAAAAHGAATAAVPVADTLKRVDGEGRVAATIDREGLWATQTPQAFRTDILRAAHDRAATDGIAATDDAMLVEQGGLPVAVVPASTRNFKITTAADLALARALVAGERSGYESGPPEGR